MSVAKVTELSCTSNESFEDAVRQGIDRANKTLRQVRSAWVKEQRVNVSRGCFPRLARLRTRTAEIAHRTGEHAMANFACIVPAAGKSSRYGNRIKIG